MILHLIGDPDFDSLIINQIEECCSGENIFLLFSPKRSLNFCENVSKDKIIFQEDFPTINYCNINGIIIHYLCIRKAKFIKRIPKSIPIACSVWGGDFYNFLPEFRKKLYSKLTKKYLDQKGGRYLLNYISQKLLFPISGDYKVWKEAVERIRIFSTVIPYEKNLVEKYFESDIKYLSLPTYSIDKVINTENFESTIHTKEKYSRNILIGNSGNLTNNHLDILYFISRVTDENISVHLPLTYGDSEYLSYICTVGNSLLGTNFCPLLNHLDYSDYYNFIDCFNIFIFNSYRQQGIGTIILALWSGGKVFLSNKNVTTSFYKDSGIKIFSIEDDLLTSDTSSLFSPLTREEILANRKSLIKLYSNETVNKSIKSFISGLKETHMIT